MTPSHIGIDPHRTVIQICVVDETGETMARERIRYTGLGCNASWGGGRRIFRSEE